MPALIIPEQSSHWYSQRGEPRYEATLREARKENLLPSPTTIIGLLRSEGLEAWKQEQTLLSALTLPRMPGEDDSAFAKRAVADSKSATRSAAELGTQVHHGVESILQGRSWDVNIPQLSRFYSWAEENIAGHDWCERVLVSLDLGVAGKADALVRFKGEAAETVGTDGPILVDWKTQRMPKNKKHIYTPRFYDKWILQLSFYAYCEMVPPPVASVVINTAQPMAPVVKRWPDDERDEAFEAFRNITAVWRWLKNYTPKIQVAA